MGYATLCDQVAVEEKRLEAAAIKFTQGERIAKREMRLLRTRELPALRQVATGCAKRSL